LDICHLLSCVYSLKQIWKTNFLQRSKTCLKDIDL
jgi:hypothetical protein